MKKLFFFTAIMAVLFTSCQMGYEKTASGLAYKIKKGEGKDTLKAGNIIKFHICVKVIPKDSILNNTFGKIPAISMVDTSANASYSFMEILPKCIVGDSITVVMKVDTMKKKGLIPDYDSLFVKGGEIRVSVKILKKYAGEQEAMMDYQNEVKLEKDREIAGIQKYLSDKKIKTQQTKGGAFVEITTLGDTTLKAVSGKVARVMYRGSLMANPKTIFDTNMDTTKGHTSPISVPVGAGQVIPGWDEALPYFGKGSKGKIYIPAMLAYGPQRQEGSPIPAYANLIFDIEVVDVKDTVLPASTMHPPSHPGHH